MKEELLEAAEEYEAIGDLIMKLTTLVANSGPIYGYRFGR